MKNEIIWKRLTDIRDEYVEEASPDNENAVKRALAAKKRLQKKIVGWGALAAALVVVVAAAYPIADRLLSGDSVIADDAYANYPTRPMRDYEIIKPGMAYTPAFEYEIDGKTERMNYPDIEWGGEEYWLTHTDGIAGTVSDEQIGEQLDAFEVTAYVYGWGDEKYTTLNAALYTCEDLDPTYAIVVKLEGVEGNLVYVSDRRAESLDELVEKTSFRTHMTTSNNIFLNTVDYWGRSVDVVFEGMTPDILWNELLSYGETVDYDGDDSYYLVLSGKDELLESEWTLYISSDGYITFRELKEGRAVYVGKERVRAFLDYLEDNLTGYRLIDEAEESPNPNGSPETVRVERTTAAQPYNPAVPE